MFKLEQEPVDYQITRHVLNLIAQFHPVNAENQVVNISNLPLQSRHPHEIITEFCVILTNPQQIEFYLEVAQWWPMEFRCAQLVQHYGVEKMTAWIKMFYGKEIYG